MKSSSPWRALALAALLASCTGGNRVAAPVDPSTAATAAPTPPAAAPAKPEAPPEEPAATGQPSADLIPRQVFFGNPERTNVQISPDGKTISWLAAKDGVLNVWVAPAADLAAARAITKETSRPVRSYFWAYDNKHVLYLQDKGGDEDFHLFRVDLASAAITDLTPLEKVRAFIYGLSPKKPDTILIGLNDRDPRYHDVYELSIASGERKKLLENKEGFAGFLYDDDFKLRFASQPTPDGGQAYLEPAKDGWQKRFEIPSDDALTTRPLGFTKKGDGLYLLDSRGRDTGALFLMDLKTGKQTLLAEDARADIGDVQKHPTERTVRAVSVEWDRVAWRVLDKKVKPDFEALAKVAEGDFQVVSQTLDDKVWLVAFFSDRKSPRYYRWERAKRSATFLFSARPALDGLPLARMHPKVIKSRDGLDLVSYLSLPVASDPKGEGKPAGPLPMVLLVHGGPWGRDTWGLHPIHQLLADRGYAVLSVNFRGSTGFGKRFVNAANGEWGAKMHDDLLDAVDWAVKGGVAAPDKVCIMGGSYGGYATLVGLSMTPDVFACGVDIVGPSNIITLLKSIPPYWASGIARFKARVGDWEDEKAREKLLAVSPLTHAAKIKRPLLIAQGANDPRVKRAESDQIVKAMQESKIPVSYMVFPDEGHGFARPENNIAFYAAAEAFLSAHLGGLYLPITAEELKVTTMKIEAGARGLPGLSQ
jgi:dipeptidyl aminopeptidase/acylaminoacyl peptidase